jgi:phosphatidylglycerol:prolipoprotein diacylglycerol transferase
MSSLGGPVGAFLGLALLHYRSPRGWLPLAEVLIQALVIGWVFGRLGCTLVHDHLGRRTAFPLAIRFPDGPRHDLGFYELLYTVLVLVPAVAVLTRRRRPPGTTLAVVALLYAPARFLGDFLRQVDLPGADPRYLGLTLAQYGCAQLAAVGAITAARLLRRPSTPR